MAFYGIQMKSNINIRCNEKAKRKGTPKGPLFFDQPPKWLLWLP